MDEGVVMFITYLVVTSLMSISIVMEDRMIPRPLRGPLTNAFLKLANALSRIGKLFRMKKS